MRVRISIESNEPVTYFNINFVSRKLHFICFLTRSSFSFQLNFEKLSVFLMLICAYTTHYIYFQTRQTHFASNNNNNNRTPMFSFSSVRTLKIHTFNEEKKIREKQKRLKNPNEFSESHSHRFAVSCSFSV